MDQITFEAFAASARAEGFDEVIEREWAARTQPHPLLILPLQPQAPV